MCVRACVRVCVRVCVYDVWNVIQQGFYVETPCHSIARPGKLMAGTRITLLQKQVYTKKKKLTLKSLHEKKKALG